VSKFYETELCNFQFCRGWWFLQNLIRKEITLVSAHVSLLCHPMFSSSFSITQYTCITTYFFGSFQTVCCMFSFVTWQRRVPDLHFQTFKTSGWVSYETLGVCLYMQHLCFLIEVLQIWTPRLGLTQNLFEQFEMTDNFFYSKHEMCVCPPLDMCGISSTSLLHPPIVIFYPCILVLLF
jgi:hypothetical protein